MQLGASLLCVGVILLSVLVHELGHACTGICFQQKVRIELAAFGGFTYREGRKLKLWEEFLVVVNGPLAGLLLALLAFTVAKFFTISWAPLALAVKLVVIINLFWTLINLIPVLPLDGGHLLSILLEGMIGFKGVRLAVLIGIGISIFTSILFFVLGMLLMGALFLIFTFESLRSLRYYKIFTEKDRDNQLQDLMKSADECYQRGDKEAAEAQLQEVRAKTKEGILYTVATEELAEIYRERERYEEAYQLLLPVQSMLSEDHLETFHFLAYANGDYQKVTEVGNKCFQDNPSVDTALINALSYGALAHAEPAVGWLECALREGLLSLQETLQRQEFDPIRNSAPFVAFRAQHENTPPG